VRFQRNWNYASKLKGGIHRAQFAHAKYYDEISVGIDFTARDFTRKN
jgi:hypothetical protein